MNWSPVTVEDVQAYLGIRVYMSILALPNIDMYWSTDPVFGNLFTQKVMKRDRFDKMTQYLHVADTTTNPARGQPEHDKLAHIRPILESVRQNCLTKYQPHQNVSIDEAMVAFRGRLGWRQYMPAKPTKYGIKVWMRADPANGYCNDFQIYTGKVAGGVEHGLGARVVRDLTNGIQGVNHIVNCDNYFSSPELFFGLLDDGLYARGTVRSNRKDFPARLLDDRQLRQQGDMVRAQKGELGAVRWRDKKIVSFISTADSVTDVVPVDRRRRDGTRHQVNAPSVVHHYNKNMNGVDHADQMRTEYPTFRKSRKWWCYLFFFLFDICACNGFILMKESPHHQMQTRQGNNKPRSLLSFKKKLAKQLIGQYRCARKRSLASNVDPGGVAHWPIKGKSGRCKECRLSGRGRRESSTRCEGCDVALCVPCFKPYHTRLQNDN